MASKTSSKVGSPTTLTMQDARLVANRLPLDLYGDEELVKLTRQLEYAVSKNGGGIDSFLENIVSSQSNDLNRINIPKRRFGKTNLQVSIVTCGGMRIQETMMPDTIPFLGSRSPVVGFGMSAIKTSCQNNLIATIRRALSIGVNHIETARYYGTSEMQLADALHAMIVSGEIKREDFVLQTKLIPNAKLTTFITQWEASWSLFDKLGYIDLLSSHGLTSEKEYKWVFENGEDSNLLFMQKLVKEGKVKHLGFATHGTPAFVAKTINRGVFSYINLHSHGVFGSYHGSGISDGAGDYGHRSNVALAKRLDMGIFVISPFDKGGKLYQPSTILQRLLGPNLTPIEFQALYQWSDLGDADTIVLGASKPSDFDESLGVLQRFRLDDPATKQMVVDAANRIRAALDAACGPGGLNAMYQGIPAHCDPKTDGIAIAHMVWMWALVKGLGMYEYAKERFDGLESCATNWKKDKSFEENILGWNGFNQGRGLISQDELIPAAALEHCPDPSKVRAACYEVHSWFAKDGIAKPTPQQLEERGWNNAFSLRTWTDYPGLNLTISGVILQRLTGGLLGVGGGPTKDKKYVQEVARTRAFWKSVALNSSKKI